MRKFVSLLLLLCSVCSSASAAETVNDIATAKVGGVTLGLNGLGVNSFLREERAIGALYLASRSEDPETIATSKQPKRMELRIIAERLSARNFAQQWTEGISLNNPAEEWKKSSAQILAFSKLFQDNLTTGDRVVIDFVPNQGTVVSVNGRQLGRVEGSTLYPLLVRAWLGNRPPSEAFKAGLLGKVSSAERSQLAQRFLQLQLNAERQAAAKKAEELRKRQEEEKRLAEEKKLREEERLKREEETRKLEERAAKAEEARIAKLEKEKAALEKKLAEERRKAEEAAKAAQAAQQAASAKPAPTQATTPAAGSNDGAADKMSSYLARNAYEKKLLRWVRAKTEYPPLAYRRGIEGNAVLRVNINRAGQVQRTVVQSSSGKQILDDAALKTVQDASPLPAIPPEIQDNEFEFLMPFNFKLPKN